jgi:hypothetical protein
MCSSLPARSRGPHGRLCQGTFCPSPDDAGPLWRSSRAGTLEETDDEEQTMPEQPMMRALVAYESMFGNTERVARAVAAGLRLEGVDVTVVDVADDQPVDLSVVDLVVVGAPTHGFSLSRPASRPDAVRQGGREDAERTGLREWLARLEHTERPRLVATFDTRVTKVRYLPASASRRAARALAERGHRLVSPSMGFLVHDVPGPLESREVDRAIAWSRGIAADARTRLAGAARS